MRRLFPVLIVSTRYASEDEHGEWVAFATDDPDLLADVQSGPRFGYEPLTQGWPERNRDKGGIGRSPNEAYENLLRKRGVLEQ